LSIDYIKSLSEETERVVQMNLEPGITSEHTLAINLDSLPDTKVILEDRQTGIFHQFNDDPVYAFHASADDNPERFLLHFVYTPSGIGDHFAKTENPIKIYSWNKTVYIENISIIPVSATVGIYNLWGGELYNSQRVLDHITALRLDLSGEFVVVKVTTPDGITTQKVFIN
jgi:hypothetical protein